MKYLVDPQLLHDILDAKSNWREAVTALFEAHKGDELILAPTSYVTLSETFGGMRSTQDRFLGSLGVKVAKNAPARVVDSAYAAWSAYQRDNPNCGPGEENAFDALYIGAYAMLYDGILSRRGDFYRRYFVSLNVLEP